MPVPSTGRGEALSLEWRDIPGYEGLYQISDYGDVRSLRLGGLLKPSVQRKGHFRVSLSGRWFLVHRLVLMTFVGPPPPECPLGLHKDGVPSNNHVANLYWGTYSSNRYDAVRHGTHNMSRKTHCKQGHEFSPENTWISSTNGQRVCRECKRSAYKPHPKPPRLICGNGHVLAEVGVRKNGNCRQCVRDWNRASRLRRKQVAA